MLLRGSPRVAAFSCDGGLRVVPIGRTVRTDLKNRTFEACETAGSGHGLGLFLGRERARRQGG